MLRLNKSRHCRVHSMPLSSFRPNSLAVPPFATKPRLAGRSRWPSASRRGGRPPSTSAWRPMTPPPKSTRRPRQPCTRRSTRGPRQPCTRPSRRSRPLGPCTTRRWPPRRLAARSCPRPPSGCFGCLVHDVPGGSQGPSAARRSGRPRSSSFCFGRTLCRRRRHVRSFGASPGGSSSRRAAVPAPAPPQGVFPPEAPPAPVDMALVAVETCARLLLSPSPCAATAVYGAESVLLSVPRFSSPCRPVRPCVGPNALAPRARAARLTTPSARCPTTTAHSASTGASPQRGLNSRRPTGRRPRRRRLSALNAFAFCCRCACAARPRLRSSILLPVSAALLGLLCLRWEFPCAVPSPALRKRVQPTLLAAGVGP